MKRKSAARQTGGRSSPLRTFRLLAGLRQEEVAVRAGVSQGFYSGVERGRLPSLDIRYKLAAALQADVAVLFPTAEESGK